MAADHKGENGIT